MTSLPGSHSRVITSYSRPPSRVPLNQLPASQLSRFWLRKSVFNPFPGLAEAFAERRQITGVDVPLVQILHSSRRWLLLQAAHVKPTFFERIKKEKLDQRQEQVLKLFKDFVELVRYYGYFRPTEKMVFMSKMECRVWINEDIFANVPQMPINQGRSSQKHFVISFLAMLQASLQNWQRLPDVITIEQATRALEWRCKLAGGSRSALNARQQANLKPEESHVSFNQSELGPAHNAISSQQLDDHTTLHNAGCALSNSFTLDEAAQFDRTKDARLVKKSAQFQIPQMQVQESLGHAKKKFALHSTSSTLGNFSEKFRTTLGRKKIMEKVQNQEEQAFQSDPQIPNIQNELQGLFETEAKAEDCSYNQEELERIAEEMEEFLIW